MQEYIDRHGFDDRKSLIDYANALVLKYGGASGALACIMYEKTAEAENKAVKTAEMADLPSYGEVAKAVNGTMKTSKASVPSTVGRLTKQVGADTTLKNALRDGAQFAWIPSGDTCAFCITLASRGWQYASKKAIKNGHAEHIHSHCDCQYAIRFNSSTNVAGYDPDKYLQMYEDATGTPKEKINEMRRKLYAEKNGLEVDDEGYATGKTLTEQEYRKVIRGEASTLSFTRNNKNVSVSVKKIESYETPVYVSDNVQIKPKALNTLIQNTNQAIKEYGLSAEESPAVVILAQNELEGASGIYDAIANTTYYSELITKSNVQSIAGGKQVIERHETWHAKQAAAYRNNYGQITEENKNDYINETCKKSKKNLDSLGITVENVDKISDYAAMMYRRGRYDETEADYMALRKKE